MVWSPNVIWLLERVPSDLYVWPMFNMFKTRNIRLIMFDVKIYKRCFSRIEELAYDFLNDPQDETEKWLKKICAFIRRTYFNLKMIRQYVLLRWVVNETTTVW